MDFDIASLCSHLEEEHYYETTIAPCPVCVANVGNDIVGHIKSQHSHLFKGHRRRKYLRGRIKYNSVPGRERLHSLVEGGSSHLGAYSSNDAPDPLLSSLIYGFPIIK